MFDMVVGRSAQAVLRLSDGIPVKRRYAMGFQLDPPMSPRTPDFGRLLFVAISRTQKIHIQTCNFTSTADAPDDSHRSIPTPSSSPQVIATMASASSSARANLPAVLSELRSGIFGTAHNPNNARTGAKYLRRRLRGPSAVAYYPRQLTLATLNAETPWNRFANWEGDSAGNFKARVLGSSGASAAQSGENQDGTWAVTAPSNGSAEPKEGEAAPQRVWAAQMNQLPAGEVVPGSKWTEVERLAGAGWVHDEKEQVRMEEVEMKRAMGRGPPKKGESLTGFGIVHAILLGLAVSKCAHCHGTRNELTF